MKTKMNCRCLTTIVAELLLAVAVGSARAAVEQDILFSYAPSYATSLGGDANTRV